MSIYGAVANGVREHHIHQMKQVANVYDLVHGAVDKPFNSLDQNNLTEQVLRMDHAKQNMDFALGIVDEILKNISSLQP